MHIDSIHRAIAWNLAGLGYLVAALLNMQPAYGASSVAQCTDSSLDPATCQWAETMAQSTPNTSLTPNAAPPPVINGVCSAPQCSDGIHLTGATGTQPGASNILFNTDYSETGQSTTCRFVDNNSSDDIFVPQKTSLEFTHFIANSPSNVSFGYCVVPKTPTYTYSLTTGYNMNGCTMTATGVNCPTGVSPITTTAPTTIPLPIVRLNSAPITISETGANYSYARQDCRTDAAGATVCVPHTIAETETVDAVTTVLADQSAQCQNPRQNLNLNCNGTWNVNIVSTCTLDGVSSATCPPPYVPPPLQPCTAADGTIYQSGATWTTTVTTNQPPTGTACSITQTPINYLCTDGLVSSTAGTVMTTSTGACASSSSSGSSGGSCSCSTTFTVSGGKIIDPNCDEFIARGVDVHGNNLPAIPSTVTTQFPGINMIRVAVEPINFDPPSVYAAAVAALTAQGIVVEFTDYTNSIPGGYGGGSQGYIFTGSLLSDELAWYTSMASYYANNPYVWLGTDNEPSDTYTDGNVYFTGPHSLSAWQAATYNAIRTAGNNNPIFLEPTGDRPPGYGGLPLQWDTDPSYYASMTNVIWDPHVGGYQDNYDTNQADNDTLVAAMIAAAQTIRSADGLVPVIIGEYGPAGANGTQIISAVASSGVGSTAWVLDTSTYLGGLSGDPTGYINGGLLSGGVITTYGQQVEKYLSTGATGAPNPGAPGGGTGALLCSGSSSSSSSGSSSSGSSSGGSSSSGSSSGGSSSSGGPTCSASTRVYVTDPSNNRVEAFDTTGKFLFQIGGTRGSGPGQFDWPLDVRIGRDGNVLVTDNHNNRVQIFDPDGNYLREFAVGAPDIIGQAPNGNYWVSSMNTWTDSQGHLHGYLYVFDSSGKQLFYTTQWQDSSGVIGMTFDADGSTWIDNVGMGSMMKVDTAGNYGFSFGPLGSGPGQFSNDIWGIDMDQKNRLWIADGGNNRVDVFDTDGKFQFQFGSLGTGNGQFNNSGSVVFTEGAENPMDVAIDGCGNAWVTDPYNSRVEKFDSNGKFLMTFGKFGTDTTNGSGPGEFHTPFGIAVR